MNRRAAKLAACAIAACAFFWTGSAHADAVQGPDLSRVLELLQRQEQRLDEQERLLRAQQQQLLEQQEILERQRRELNEMSRGDAADLDDNRGAGAPNAGPSYRDFAADEPIPLNRQRSRNLIQAEQGGSTSPEATPAAAPQGPVGEAPPEETHVSTV
ncbi:MAG: hypothetical protein AB7T58_15235, partial [Hyphomonadaceae bacterium]